MSKANHTYLIDPEFSFMGFSEFDNGVMATHTAGIEIMRRLIGLAQSPLKRAIEEKKLLLKVARTLILN